MKKSYVFIITLVVFQICYSQKNITFKGMKHEVSGLVLTSDQYQSLKLYIQKITGVIPKDTLCIWFHYNHNNCWKSWDYMHTNKEAADWATYINTQFEKHTQKHPKTTIVQARALGNNANKMVMANPKVFFDTERIIESLFFKEPKNCSSSVIIYPDKSCLIINDDPHYDFLFATKKLLQ
ncbi:MAG: hypothetical protein ACOVMM_06865 [Chitinophagaceae bacterium]